MTINKEKLIQRIKELCAEKGIKPTTAYIESGVGKNFKSNMSYAEPSLGKLNLLANYFEVTIEYLIGETNERIKSNTFDISSIPGAFLPKTKKLPFLGSIACGKPIFAEEDFNGYIDVIEGVQADFCLQAKGDSMIGARIYDGDIVFIRKQETVYNGEIAVVLIEDEATLKRVYYYPEKNTLILKPENSNYEDTIFTGEELNNISILGKAVAFQSLIR